MDVTLDALGNKGGHTCWVPSRPGSMEEEGKESAFTFDVDSQTRTVIGYRRERDLLVKDNCCRRERDLL